MGPSCGGRVGPGVELGVPLAQGLRIGGYHQGRGFFSGGQSSETEKKIRGIKGTYLIFPLFHNSYQNVILFRAGTLYL